MGAKFCNCVGLQKETGNLDNKNRFNTNNITKNGIDNNKKEAIKKINLILNPKIIINSQNPQESSSICENVFIRCNLFHKLEKKKC